MRFPSPRSSQRGGLLAKLFVFFLVVAVLATIAWIVLLPSIVVSTIQSKTGFTARLESLSVNPFTARVHLRGLVLENPAGWPERAFVEVRELRADADVLPLLQGKLVADEVVVDIPRLTLVRNRDGLLNALAFKEGFTGPAQKPTPAAKPTEKGAPPEFLVRDLRLKFGQLTYADHSGRKPTTRDYALNISTELRDVDSVADLLVPFKGAAFGAVADALGSLTGAAPGKLQEIGTFLKDTGKKASDSLKGLLEKAKP